MTNKLKNILILILFISIATEIYNLTHIENIKAISTNLDFTHSPLLCIYNFIYEVGTVILFAAGYKKRILVVMVLSLIKAMVIDKPYLSIYAALDSAICLIILFTIVIDITIVKEYRLEKKTKGLFYLWVTFKNNHSYCIFWECNTPIWWFPKLERSKAKSVKGFRLGWLLFSIGIAIRDKQTN